MFNKNNSKKKMRIIRASEGQTLFNKKMEEYKEARAVTQEQEINYIQIMANVEQQDEETNTVSEEIREKRINRAKTMNRMTIEIDGIVFDADETSQTRMTRSIVCLDEGEEIPWIDANNSLVYVTKDVLKKALKEAGKRQTAIWNIY